MILAVPRGVTSVLFHMMRVFVLARLPSLYYWYRVLFWSVIYCSQLESRSPFAFTGILDALQVIFCLFVLIG